MQLVVHHLYRRRPQLLLAVCHSTSAQHPRLARQQADEVTFHVSVLPADNAPSLQLSSEYAELNPSGMFPEARPTGSWSFAPRKFLKYNIHICKFWCILIAIERLVPAAEWLYSRGISYPFQFLIGFMQMPWVVLATSGEFSPCPSYSSKQTSPLTHLHCPLITLQFNFMT